MCLLEPELVLVNSKGYFKKIKSYIDDLNTRAGKVEQLQVTLHQARYLFIGIGQTGPTFHIVLIGGLYFQGTNLEKQLLCVMVVEPGG